MSDTEDSILWVVKHHRKYGKLEKLAEDTGIPHVHLLLCDITGHVPQGLRDKYDTFVAIQTGKYLGFINKDYKHEQ